MLDSAHSKPILFVRHEVVDSLLCIDILSVGRLTFKYRIMKSHSGLRYTTDKQFRTPCYSIIYEIVRLLVSNLTDSKNSSRNMVHELESKLDSSRITRL
jgi:hypothetical protein